VKMIPEYVADTAVMAHIDPHYLRFLPLTGRFGYLSQGYYGETSTVAVIDSGVNAGHPEFLDDTGKTRVVDLMNFSGYGNGEDDNGHGTHVAATISGRAVGVAPKAKILSVKVLDAVGDSDWAKISRGLEAVLRWRGPDGRRVTAVSMSLSQVGRRNSPDIQRLEAAIKALTDAEIPVIVSAGNTAKYEERYPASFYDPITVGAVDVENLTPAGFSTENKEVDVCQVGVNVLSAYYRGGYVAWSGTSMATPIVAGIVALIKDKHYQIFGEDMLEMATYWFIKNSTKDIGIKGLNPKTGAGFCTLQPVVCDLYTRHGDEYMTLNKQRVPLRAPVAVVPPGVTSLPARELFTDTLGGLTEWNPETKFARFRL
jgi:major intracellular serine protease